jgi:hypothetical protein
MSSILLIGPKPLRLRGRSEGVRTAELGDWELAEELENTLRTASEDVVAIGQACEMDVDALRSRVETGMGEGFLVPLESYDWAAWTIGLPGDLTALLPGIESGMLAVMPRDRVRELVRPSPTAEYVIRGTLRRLSHIADNPAGEPTVRFVPPRLCPGSAAEAGAVADSVRSFDPETVAAVVSPPDAVAVKAGLLLMHDRLHESHALSQSIEGEGMRRAGDYWHAIMHRREPDYGNAKYWFRHVGRHPLFDELAGWAGSVLPESSGSASQWAKKLGIPGTWDPMAFVDLCESVARDEKSALGIAARRIQWHEMLLLLRWTCVDAFGVKAPRK